MQRATYSSASRLDSSPALEDISLRARQTWNSNAAALDILSLQDFVIHSFFCLFSHSFVNF